MTETAEWLARRLREGRPLLLDGALGTELEARRIPSELPLWSTHALLQSPETIEAICREYVDAGAEILTANTFRTQARVLARASSLVAPRFPHLQGPTDWARELTGRAIRIAQRCATDRAGAIRVAGSAPPLEDCYRPDLVPDPDALAAEHHEHVRNLAEQGADLILIETINTIREGVVAAQAASQSGLPFLVSFVCSTGGLLLSGESLAQAIEDIRPHSPAAVLVNCLPPSALPGCLAVLRDGGLPFGCYANLGEPDAGASGGRSEACTPERFADEVEHWIAGGARIVGGCCGTSPRHIAEIHARGLAGAEPAR